LAFHFKLFIYHMRIRTLSASTKYLIQEAKKRNYKIEIVNENQNLLYISDGKQKILFKNIDGGANSALGYKISQHKDISNQIFKHHQFPYPKSLEITNFENIPIDQIDKEIGYPCVVKPTDTNHGIGISCDINDTQNLTKAIQYAAQFTKAIIIQKQLTGHDHRIIIINNKISCGTKRIPAHIIWNGKNSIQELIEIENKNPLRGSKEYDKPLVQIYIDEIVHTYLDTKYKMTINDIPPNQKTIYLRGNSNTGTWWTYQNFTPNDIHPNTQKLCLEVTKIFWLKICWIDIITQDISQQLNIKQEGIIEVGATPAIFSYNTPQFLKNNINPAADILNMHFTSLKKIKK